MKYLYIVQGYEKMKFNGDLENVSEVKLHAENEIEAIEKAKSLIDKKFYRVSQVIELEGGE